MRSAVLALLALAGLQAGAFAQGGSTLSMTLDPMAGDLTASLTGAPADAATFIAFGPSQGSTSLFRGQLVLDLDRRFFFLRAGRTDQNGDLTVTNTRIPMRAMAGTTLHFQAVTVEVAVTRTPGGMRPHRHRRPHRRPHHRPHVTRTFTFTKSNVASQTF